MVSFLSAMEQQEKNKSGNENNNDIGVNFFPAGFTKFTNPQLNRFQQNMKAFKSIDQALKDLGIDPSKIDADTITTLPKDVQSMLKLREKILNALSGDSIYGRVIAMGLAGSDGQLLKDECISGVAEGIELGTLMRVSRACSNVLSKRIESGIDRLFGSTWDAIVSFIAGVFQGAKEHVFHGGIKPFDPKHIKGWHELVKVSFDDLERLLKDGLKDSMRGHDMTLRTQENTEEDEDSFNAWQILAFGYIRQFDYVAMQIEKSIGYYESEALICFYAQELKQRLLEVTQLLSQSSSLKKMDELLDSNKSLIPALRKNILNLFTRLVESVELHGNSSSQTINRSLSSKMDNGDSDKKDMFPKQFHHNM